MILHTRTQLMKWLTKNAPTASIRRAVGEGSVEFLGWFSVLQGSKHPGWVVKVISTITPTLWHVVIRKRLDQLWYHAWILIEPVPWEFWNPGNSDNPFIQGDQPDVYRQRRKNAQAERREEIHQEDI